MSLTLQEIQVFSLSLSCVKYITQIQMFQENIDNLKRLFLD